MSPTQADTTINGLPPQPASTPDRSLHDTAVNDGPTTGNGLLSRRPDSVQDREITAYFADPNAAEAARAALLGAGLSASAIELVSRAEHSARVAAAIQPADDSLLGRLRDAIVPDEITAAARAAVDRHEAILRVRPDRAEVETVVRVLEGCAPTRFDADLERWRNKG